MDISKMSNGELKKLNTEYFKYLEENAENVGKDWQPVSMAEFYNNEFKVLEGGKNNMEIDHISIAKAISDICKSDNAKKSTGFKIGEINHDFINLHNRTIGYIKPFILDVLPILKCDKIKERSSSKVLSDIAIKNVMEAYIMPNKSILDEYDYKNIIEIRTINDIINCDLFKCEMFNNILEVMGLKSGDKAKTILTFEYDSANSNIGPICERINYVYGLNLRYVKGKEYEIRTLKDIDRTGLFDIEMDYKNSDVIMSIKSDLKDHCYSSISVNKINTANICKRLNCLYGTNLKYIKSDTIKITSIDDIIKTGLFRSVTNSELPILELIPVGDANYRSKCKHSYKVGYIEIPTSLLCIILNRVHDVNFEYVATQSKEYEIKTLKDIERTGLFDINMAYKSNNNVMKVKSDLKKNKSTTIIVNNTGTEKICKILNKVFGTNLKYVKPDEILITSIKDILKTKLFRLNKNVYTKTSMLSPSNDDIIYRSNSNICYKANADMTMPIDLVCVFLNKIFDVNFKYVEIPEKLESPLTIISNLKDLKDCNEIIVKNISMDSESKLVVYRNNESPINSMHVKSHTIGDVIIGSKDDLGAICDMLRINYGIKIEYVKPAPIEIFTLNDLKAQPKLKFETRSIASKDSFNRVYYIVAKSKDGDEISIECGGRLISDICEDLNELAGFNFKYIETTYIRTMEDLINHKDLIHCQSVNFPISKDDKFFKCLQYKDINGEDKLYAYSEFSLDHACNFLNEFGGFNFRCDKPKKLTRSSDLHAYMRKFGSLSVIMPSSNGYNIVYGDCKIFNSLPLRIFENYFNVKLTFLHNMDKVK